MKAINANNDITSPNNYEKITSHPKWSGILCEVYGCVGKEFFVIGKSESHLFLWDCEEWKTKVSSSAKTYKKDAFSVLIGGNKSWNDVKTNIPSLPLF